MVLDVVDAGCIPRSYRTCECADHEDADTAAIEDIATSDYGVLYSGRAERIFICTAGYKDVVLCLSVWELRVEGSVRKTYLGSGL